MDIETVKFATPEDCPPYVHFLQGSTLRDALNSLAERIHQSDDRLMFWENPNFNPTRPSSCVSRFSSSYYRFALADRKIEGFSRKLNWHHDGTLQIFRRNTDKITARDIRITETFKGVGTYFYYIENAIREKITEDTITRDEDVVYPYKSFDLGNYIAELSPEYKNRIHGPYTPKLGQVGFILHKEFGNLATFHGAPFAISNETLSELESLRFLSIIHPWFWRESWADTPTPLARP